MFCDGLVVLIISTEPLDTDQDGTQWFSVKYSIDGIVKTEVLGFNNGTVINSKGEKIR